MPAGITIEKAWSDEHLMELRVTVSDGRSAFVQTSYVGYEELEGIHGDLESFSAGLPNGEMRIQFGKFGPDHANGAFRADLRGIGAGRVRISTSQETEFDEFPDGTSATSSAKLHLVVEPAALDRFLPDLRLLAEGHRSEARLDGV